MIIGRQTFVCLPILSNSMKTESLKNPDFRRVYGQGRSKADHTIIVYALANGLSKNRLGITVSKKIGNSVVRSRVKRIIKEAYRLHEAEFSEGWDIVIIARKSAVDKKSTHMEKSLMDAGEKLRLLL